MEKKIFSRFIVLIILTTLLSTLCCALAFYTLFEKQVHEDMQVTAQIFKDTEFFDDADITKLENNPKLSGTKLRVTLLDAEGTVLFDNTVRAGLMENHADRPEIKKAKENGWGEKIRKSDTVGHVDYYYAITLNDGKILRISKEIDSIFMVLGMALPFSAAIVIIISYIGIIITKLLTKKLIAPIDAVAGKLDDEYVEAPYPELEPFMSKIRKQHEQVLESAKKMQDFSTNASHELKTPLTAISGYAQLIEGGELDAERITHFSHEIDRNASRMLNLIDDIIKLSKLDTPELAAQFEKVDLYQIAKESLAEHAEAAAAKNIDLQLEGTSTIVGGIPNLLGELLDNLVQNSIRYTDEGGKVLIRIYELDGCKYLSVEDNGIGIPSDDIDRVFERFYRVDKSRSKAGGGTGLGLAIVKHIADIHEAEIEIESQLNSGTKVTVVF
ncbi:sensor histidine kinase [Pseudobutyrivibrio sp. MD2005]|uniref:sensor histidine kinase n=1 Tax=Pseudobutyrivibrio sp. MD2005 TaxID=1410616 RepID=UPI000486809C|nr:ATP-binding protein [Pseudobutyrivibrio sp. MD2005]